MVDDFWLADLAGALNMKLTKAQGDAVRAIIAQMDAMGVTDKNQRAYILATAYHECRFKSICEIRAKPGTAVYKMQEKYWHTGFYGRGLCQLTWARNYRKFSEVVGIDLVKHPDNLLDVEIGAKILVYGMVNGSFTAWKLHSTNRLGRYISDVKVDFIGARRIINGTFMAEMVRDAAVKISALC